MSASYSADELLENDEASAADEIEEEVQTAISEEDYSSEFAEATLEDGVSATGRRSSQSMDEAIHSKKSSSHSYDEDLSPKTPGAPLVGIGSPPKTSKNLPSSTLAGMPDGVAEVDSDEGESYDEDFVEGTVEFDRTPRRGSQSYTDDFLENSATAEIQTARSQSYSEDFAEASATVGKSQSGTLEMSEALESSCKEASATSLRQLEEAERLRQEAGLRAKVEARRQQQALAKAQDQATRIEKVDEEIATEESELEESKASLVFAEETIQKEQESEKLEADKKSVASAGFEAMVEPKAQTKEDDEHLKQKSALDAFLSVGQDNEERRKSQLILDAFLAGGQQEKEPAKLSPKADVVAQEVSDVQSLDRSIDSSRSGEQRQLQQKQEAEEALKQQALLDTFFQKGSPYKQEEEEARLNEEEERKRVEVEAAEKRIKVEKEAAEEQRRVEAAAKAEEERIKEEREEAQKARRAAAELERIKAEQEAEAYRKRKEEEESVARKHLEEKRRMEETARIVEERKRLEEEEANKKRIQAEDEIKSIEAQRRIAVEEQDRRVAAAEMEVRLGKKNIEAAEERVLFHDEEDEERIRKVAAEDVAGQKLVEEGKDRKLKKERDRTCRADGQWKPSGARDTEKGEAVRNDKRPTQAGKSQRRMTEEDNYAEQSPKVVRRKAAEVSQVLHEKNDDPSERPWQVSGEQAAESTRDAGCPWQVWDAGEWNDKTKRSDMWWSSKKDWWSWSASTWSWYDARNEPSHWKGYDHNGYGNVAYDEGNAWSTLVTPSNASNRGFNTLLEERDVRIPPIHEEREASPFQSRLQHSLHWSQVDRSQKVTRNRNAYAREQPNAISLQGEEWLQDFRLGLHFRDDPVSHNSEKWKDRLARHLGLDKIDDAPPQIGSDAQWLEDLRLEGAQFKEATSAYAHRGSQDKCRDDKVMYRGNRQTSGMEGSKEADVPLVVDARGARMSFEEGPTLRSLPSADDLNPADFGGLVALAVGEVVDNLLELKYGSGLDIAAFVKLVGEACEGYTSLSIERMLTDLNNKQELAFLDKRREHKVQLRFGYRKLQSFDEVRRVIRLIPGTASAIAVIACASGNPSLDVVAAFRAAYSDSSLIVGRTSRGGGQPLRHFGQNELCGAVAVDPIIVSMTPVNSSLVGGVDVITDPPHAPEYIGLEPLLRYVNGEQGTVPAAAGGKMVPVPPSLLAIIHATAPSEEMMRKVSDVLERPDLEPDGIVEVFRKLSEWLKHEPESTVAQRAIAGALGHKVMIVSLHRHSTNRELCSWACRVIGWSSRHHVDNAVLFLEAGGIKEICSIMERHRVDKDLHRHALYALGCLAHYGGGALHAVAAGAVSTIFRSMKVHRDSPSVQINGCELLRCLAESGEAPMDDLGLVAQEAKRAFARDRGVHRAADALLLLVVPRTVGTVGMLMDSKQADASVQNSAARTLGQLASYGGVAWTRCASGAVSRIMRAMENHRSDVGLQAVCLWALGRLAERVEAPTAGMFDAAHRAKANHPDSALVLRHAEQLCMYLTRA